MLVEKWRPGTGGHNKLVGLKFLLVRCNGPNLTRLGNESLDRGIFQKDNSLAFQFRTQGAHQFVGSQMAIALVMPSTPQAGFQCGFQLNQRIAIVGRRANTKFFLNETLGSLIMFKASRRIENEQDTDFFPFAVDLLIAYQLLIELLG